MSEEDAYCKGYNQGYTKGFEQGKEFQEQKDIDEFLADLKRKYTRLEYMIMVEKWEKKLADSHQEE